ncbi:Retrovirus-related Pol poly from transposon [Paramuricea clavata]|uniref:Retrovirus-related Pol poly from transposon n=1 Tax=Paramuricea clavata TaxID=317549 RepID=A0A6S7GR48_PARCT|nr:Retrovirus-related Pol poly from transposon [Paramuricea clavata]
MDMELKAFEDELPNLFLRKDGLLCHYDSDRNTRIVIPRCLIPRVLVHMMHNDMGHFGFKKTFQRIKDKYFWPQMSSEIEDWCRKDQKAETIAKEVFDGWIPRHRAPEQLHHDQGKNLTAEIIREVCSFLEIWNTRTTPFHPQSDGASERSIRTVNNMLVKVVTEDQRNCDLKLRLPSDVVMNDQQTPKNNSHTEYATELKKRLAKAFKCSRETLESSYRTQKHYYDRDSTRPQEEEKHVQSEQISGQLVANDGDTVESRSDVVIVVDGPGADDEHQIQQREVEPVVLEPEGRPQRQRRPPAWLVPYEIKHLTCGTQFSFGEDSVRTGN